MLLHRLTLIPFSSVVCPSKLGPWILKPEIVTPSFVGPPLPVSSAKHLISRNVEKPVRLGPERSSGPSDRGDRAWSAGCSPGGSNEATLVRVTRAHLEQRASVTGHVGEVEDDLWSEADGRVGSGYLLDQLLHHQIVVLSIDVGIGMRDVEDGGGIAWTVGVNIDGGRCGRDLGGGRHAPRQRKSEQRHNPGAPHGIAFHGLPQCTAGAGLKSRVLQGPAWRAHRSCARVACANGVSPPARHHSDRSAAIGSTRTARRAGTQLASTRRAASASAASANVAGSPAPTPTASWRSGGSARERRARRCTTPPAPAAPLPHHHGQDGARTSPERHADPNSCVRCATE